MRRFSFSFCSKTKVSCPWHKLEHSLGLIHSFIYLFIYSFVHLLNSLQKPVKKRLRIFKQHQALKDDKTKETIPAEKTTETETGKSLSRDLLKKVIIILLLSPRPLLDA